MADVRVVLLSVPYTYSFSLLRPAALQAAVLLLLLLMCNGVLAQAPPAYQNLPPSDSAVSEARAPAARASGAFDDYNQAYYSLKAVNEGMPAAADTLYRISPQETLETYIRACRAGDFASAAQTLNLNLIPRSQQASQGPVLAQQLYYVLDQRIGLDWGGIPDRPDGAATKPGPGAGTLNEARRSITVGELLSEGRAVTLRLQRVRTGDAPPYWLWAMGTVEEISGLYANYGPGWLEQHVPNWLRMRVAGVPLWVLVGMFLAVALCWLVGWLVYRGFGWLCAAVPLDWANVLGDRLAKPVGAAVGILLYYFILKDVLSLSGPWARGFFTLMLIVVVATVIWVASRGIDYVIEYFVERRLADITDESNDQARTRMTMLSVGRRVLVFALLVIGVAVVFSRVSGLEQVGYALMGSAGFAAVVLGIAAQSTLGNLVAGIQVAVTRPVRIGDSVLYEGNMGNVEDVRFTYLVIRTWDLRRLIVPLKYFIDNPFENWSMTDSKMLKTFYVYADYRIDVDAVRKKFDELVRGHELYNDHKPPDFIVYAVGEESIKMRGTVSAENSSEAWTLHCDVREALVRYIADLEADVLPRERVQVISQST